MKNLSDLKFVGMFYILQVVSLFAVVLTIPVFSQNVQWSKLNVPEGGNPTTLVLDPSNENIVYAPTFDGGLYKSIDGGNSWIDIGVPNGLRYLKIPQAFFYPDSSNKLYVVTNRLLKTETGGNSYLEIPSPAVPINMFNAADVSRSNEQIIYANIAVDWPGVGQLTETLFRSLNAGQNWDSLSTVRARSIAINPFNAQSVFIATQGRGLLRTYDGGQTWYPANAGIPDSNFLQIAYHPQDTTILYAVTGEARLVFNKVGGKIYRSTNSGQQWNEVMNGINPIYGVTCFSSTPNNPDRMYIGMLDPKVFVTTDGGNNWQALSSHPPFGRIYSITPTSTGEVYISSTGIGIFKYEGGVWQQKNSGFSAAEVLVTRVNSTINSVFVGGPEGSAKSTGIAGETWSRIGETFISFDYCKTQPHILYAGVISNGTIYKSTDGGNNWSYKTGMVPYNLPVGAIAVHPYNPDIVYAGAGTSQNAIRTVGLGLFKSTDGGDGFVQLTQGLPDSILVHGIVINPSDPNKICISTQRHGIYKSTDGGINWLPKNNGIENLLLWNLVMAPSNPNILFTGNHFHNVGETIATQGTFTRLYRSSDFGETWDSSVATVASRPPGPGTWILEENIEGIAVHPLDPNIIYVGTHGVGVFRTTNGGTTWTRENTGMMTSPEADHIYTGDLAMDDSGKVIYSGSCGRGVFRAILHSSMVTGVIHAGSNFPTEFILEQNYPNPLNPTTTIRFDLPKAVHVTLSIYNMMGQEVTTLLSANYPAGRFVTIWDATGFASGLYLYQLQAGTYRETRKLLLVK